MKIFLFFCLTLVFFSSKAQKDSSVTKKKLLKSESFMDTRVALIDEFFKRFNYQISPEGKPYDSLSKATYSREDVLYQLFDEIDTRPKTQKNTFLIAKKAFVTKIMLDSVYLNKKEALPYAELKTLVKYQGKEQELILYLKKMNKNGIYDWKIIGATVPFIKPITDTAYVAKVRKDTSNVAISPHAQETDFLSLHAHLRKSVPLLKFVANNQQNDPFLIALSKKIEENQLIFESFETSVYINTHKDWVIKLDYFARETDNSGWLISDLFGSLGTPKLPIFLQNYMNTYDKNIVN